MNEKIENILKILEGWVGSGRGRLDSDDWLLEDIIEMRNEIKPLVVNMIANLQ
jgi:hypothetical protein